MSEMPAKVVEIPQKDLEKQARRETTPSLRPINRDSLFRREGPLAGSEAAMSRYLIGKFPDRNPSNRNDDGYRVAIEGVVAKIKASIMFIYNTGGGAVLIGCNIDPQGNLVRFSGPVLGADDAGSAQSFVNSNMKTYVYYPATGSFQEVSRTEFMRILNARASRGNSTKQLLEDQYQTPLSAPQIGEKAKDENKNQV